MAVHRTRRSPWGFPIGTHNLHDYSLNAAYFMGQEFVVLYFRSIKEQQKARIRSIHCTYLDLIKCSEYYSFKNLILLDTPIDRSIDLNRFNQKICYY